MHHVSGILQDDCGCDQIVILQALLLSASTHPPDENHVAKPLYDSICGGDLLAQLAAANPLQQKHRAHDLAEFVGCQEKKMQRLSAPSRRRRSGKEIVPAWIDSAAGAPGANGAYP